MLIAKCYNHLEFNKWLEKLRLVDPPIHEANARVCSDHFTEMCYISSMLEGFGPSRRTLKPDAVPTIFSFHSLPKRRKLSEARQAKAQHRSVVEELLEEQTSDVATETERVVTTRDVGTQCGKLTKKYMITVITDVEL